MRIFNDVLEGNVFGGRAIFPSAVLTGNMVVDPHSANQGCVLILLAFVTDQVRETVPCLHRTINAVKKTLKRAILIISTVADVKHSHTTLIKPVCYLKRCMKYLRPFVSGKATDHASSPAPRKKFTRMQFIVEGDAVNVTEVLSPTLQPIKNLVPFQTWDANSRENIQRTFR